jgi:UDP-N-acetylmuramyl pentapeptide phosphotransferase/UDP-N-acetylglucosamine-1-phosphate transferase
MIGPAIALCAAAAAVSFLAAEAMRRSSHRLGFTDAPNERSSHSAPTPRAGGVGFALAVPAIGALALSAAGATIDVPSRALLVASAALAVVGLADDRWGLPAGVRLVAQLAAASAVAAAGGALREVAIPGLFSFTLGPMAIPVTVAWLVALTNIYNFMDGIDGLAATQAIVAAGSIAVIAVCLGHAQLAAALLVLCGGALGFLLLNLPPARVFMGDVGSTFLGFTMAGWSVLGTHLTPPVPLVAWVAVLSPFLFDSATTLVRRLWRGERIHEAHRTHMYQRLVARGWPHGRTTLLYGSLAVVSCAFAIVASCTAGGAGPVLWALALLPPLAIPAVVWWRPRPLQK